MTFLLLAALGVLMALIYLPLRIYLTLTARGRRLRLLQRIRLLRQQLGDEMARNEDRGLDFRPTSGESPREVQSRVLKWMRTLGAANSVSMIVTHKGVIRSVLAAAFDWPMLGRAPVQLDWGRCHHFVLESDGRIRLAQPNLTLTLPPPPQPLV